MSFEDNLPKIIEKHQELSNKLSSGIMGDDFIKFSRDFSELEPIVEKINKYNDLKAEIESLQEMLIDLSLDKEMIAMAHDELNEAQSNLVIYEKEVKIALLPKDDADTKNAIIEVRAGTGGDEAALFASDLFEMYQKYSDLRGWKFEVLSISYTGIGGYKEASASISGQNVFARLKFESGVHRVQRIPSTESSGRIHTSAATVAVLPEAEEVDLRIEEKDLRVDTYRSSGAGGQHVNTTDSAVRITHIPTNVVVTCQDERSQIKNKAQAMKILRSRLYEAQRQKLADDRARERKEQIGSGDRSERIRTYNFPQGRVSDHRINMTLYKFEDIVRNGQLDEFIDALIADDEAKKLSAEVER